jgi:hypothetical protein
VLVGREDKLFVAVVEIVEQMEEFFFCFFHFCQKLHIVHDEQVILAVFFLKRLYFSGLERGNIVHRELFGRDVLHLSFRGAGAEVVPYRLDKVGFT